MIAPGSAARKPATVAAIAASSLKHGSNTAILGDSTLLKLAPSTGCNAIEGINGGFLAEPRRRDVQQPEVGWRVDDGPRLAWRNHEAVGGLQRKTTAKVEARRAFEDEAEDQLTLVGRETHRRSPGGTHELRLGQSVGRLPDFRPLRFATVKARPRRVGIVSNEALPFEASHGIDAVRKLQLVVGERLVQRRAADLDHFEAG